MKEAIECVLVIITFGIGIGCSLVYLGVDYVKPELNSYAKSEIYK